MMIFHDVWHVLSPQRRERNMFGFKAHKSPLRRWFRMGLLNHDRNSHDLLKNDPPILQRVNHIFHNLFPEDEVDKCQVIEYDTWKSQYAK